MIKLFAIYILFFNLAVKASVEAPAFETKELKILKTPADWKKISVRNKTEILLALQSESKGSSLTLRLFESFEPSLKKNAVKWIQDYKNYGFKITSSKPVKLNESTYGFQIKALHKKSKKVFKQYMSIQNKRLLVLTCHSEKENKDFQKCTESLASFSWKKIQ